MKRLLEQLFLFYIGGSTYVNIEVIWRGYSHWSMGIVGGLCFLLVGLINQVFPWQMKLWAQILIATGMVTVVELLAGLVLNVWLGMGVWDYSQIPFNVLGQICLGYFFLWIPLSVVAILLDDWLRYCFFDAEKPKYIWR